MRKIAVLSDTHDLLRPEVLERIQTCDGLIHGGDINSQRVIDEILNNMKPRAPVYFVRGNNDGEWANYLAKYQAFTLEGVNFYLVHNKRDVPWNLGDRQIVIYGHSHKYAEEEKDGRLWLNPGSCGRCRFYPEITMALLYLDDGKWSVERVDLLK